MENDGQQKIDCLENIEKTRATLYKYGLYIWRNHADAEDIAQEALLRALQRKREDETADITNPYLKAIVRNEKISFWRKNGKGTVESLETEDGAAFEIADNAPEIIIRSDKSKEIDKAALDQILYKKLSDEEEQIFMLYAVNELSAEEIAAEIGEDVAVVRAILNLIKNRIIRRSENFANSHKKWYEEILTIFKKQR